MILCPRDLRVELALQRCSINYVSQELSEILIWNLFSPAIRTARYGFLNGHYTPTATKWRILI